MASKKRQKKSGTKKASRKHRGLSSWQKFMKSKKGQGLKVKQISKLYHAAGHGKKKAPKKARGKKAAKKTSKKAAGSAPKSYVSQFKSRLIKIYTDGGLSLATAKARAREVLSKQRGLNAVEEQWQNEFQVKMAEANAKAATKMAEKRQAEAEAEEARLAAEGDREDQRRAKKESDEAKKATEKAIREAKIVAAQRAKLDRDRKRLEEKAAKYASPSSDGGSSSGAGSVSVEEEDEFGSSSFSD